MEAGSIRGLRLPLVHPAVRPADRQVTLDPVVAGSSPAPPHTKSRSRPLNSLHYGCIGWLIPPRWRDTPDGDPIPLESLDLRGGPHLSAVQSWRGQFGSQRGPRQIGQRLPRRFVKGLLGDVIAAGGPLLFICSALVGARGS